MKHSKKPETPKVAEKVEMKHFKKPDSPKVAEKLESKPKQEAPKKNHPSKK